MKRKPRKPLPMPININVNHRYADGDVRCLLEYLLEQQRCILAKLSTFNDLLDAMNTTTNEIASNVQILIDKLNAGGMSETEEQEVLAKMQTQADALKAVAASSSNPAPPVPPVE